MAATPHVRKTAPPPCRLEPFDPRHAERVLSWISSPEEAYWVAPRTAPPLTAEEVLQWQAPGHQPFLLFENRRAEPIGYGELNVLNGPGRRYWLGHLILDPAQRGRGCGRQLTRLLLESSSGDARKTELRRGVIRIELERLLKELYGLVVLMRRDEELAPTRP